MSQQLHDIAVVVCTRNRPLELERCLASLDGMVPPAKEIVVVNSAGDEAAKEIALRHGAQYVYAPLPGLSYARNIGASVANCDVLAFLDDDSIADRGWVGALVAGFADPAVAAVTGTIAPLSDTGDFGWEHFDNSLRELPRREVDSGTPDWFWFVNTGRLGVGGNMAFRRDVFEHWPGFDLRLGRGAPIPGAEEHFAFFQLIRLGYRCVHVPEAIVSHPGLSSLERLREFELEMITITAAYMTMLFAEYPEYRLELVKRVTRRLRLGSDRSVGVSIEKRFSRREGLSAVWQGLLAYWSARRSRHHLTPCDSG